MSATLLLKTAKVLAVLSKVKNEYVGKREYVTDPQSMFAVTVHSLMC
jgi:hypothetical protein